MNGNINGLTNELSGWWNAEDLGSNLHIGVDTALSKDWSDLRVIGDCNSVCAGNGYVEGVVNLPWSEATGKIELDQDAFKDIIHETLEKFFHENEDVEERPTIEKYHIKHK